MTGKYEFCGKPCREEYCKIHRYKIRPGRKIPLPCLLCGVGVRSEIQLCRDCGRETLRHRIKSMAQSGLITPCLRCGVEAAIYNQMYNLCLERQDIEDEMYFYT